MIDLERLNDHSRHFATDLFRLWPEWIRYARYDPYEDFEKEALLVEVPRPVDGGSGGLYITTSEWEVSVGFGESFHTRFGVSGGKDDPSQTDFYTEALDFIQAFVDEQIVLATAFENNEWLGGWKIDLRQEALADVDVEPGVVVKLRSWRGTWDREIQTDRAK